ncbi:MAG: RNA polymerase sigma factor [Pseudomonadota bacterium]
MRDRSPAQTDVRHGLADVFPRLWRYCLTLTANRADADDLAQAACLRAIERAHLFEPGTHLDRWVFTIAHRIWLNELRAARLRRGGGLAPIEDVDLIDEKADTEMNFSARELLRKVLRLPEAQRVVVLLVYVEGYAYKEAAAIIGIPIGTVMSRLAAARKKLAAQDSEQASKRA